MYLPAGVDDIPGDLHIFGDARIELLQRARQFGLHRRRWRPDALISGAVRPSQAAAIPRRPLSAAHVIAVREGRASEELGEDVVDRLLWRALEPLLPILVVHCPLTGVAENLITQSKMIKHYTQIPFHC